MSKKIIIIAIEYPKEQETEIEKILKESDISLVGTKISDLPGSEMTNPYRGNYDSFIDDVLDILVTHIHPESTTILSKITNKTYLPSLIKEFKALQQKYNEGKPQ